MESRQLLDFILFKNQNKKERLAFLLSWEKQSRKGAIGTMGWLSLAH